MQSLNINAAGQAVLEKSKKENPFVKARGKRN